MRGNHASVDVLPSRMAREPLRLKPKWQKSIPFDFPGIVLNPLSIAAFNNFYYAVHPDVTGKLMSFDDYFCPLDSIANWNRMYGKRGFGQYQVTVPLNDSKGLVALLERVSQSHCASFLAVLKRLGPVNDACLSYPSDGFTFTMDIPMRSDLVSLLHELDRLVVEHGGRLYCAKDATAQPETFAAMYPKLDVFRQVKAKVDPDNRFSSSMARRLGIVPERKGGVCGN